MNILAAVLLTIGGALIGALVTVIVARKYRPKKELSGILLEHESTINITDGIKDKITIRYKGRKVESLERIKVAFVNTGNRAIKKEDITVPIRLGLPDKTKIIEIVKIFPNTTSYVLDEGASNEIEVDFDLINPGETIALELLVRKCNRKGFYIKGRGAELKIKWLRTVKLVGVSEQSINWLIGVLGFSILVSLSSLTYRCVKGLPADTFWGMFSITALAVSFLILICFTILILLIKLRLVKQKQLEMYLRSRQGS